MQIWIDNDNDLATVIVGKQGDFRETLNPNTTEFGSWQNLRQGDCGEVTSAKGEQMEVKVGFHDIFAYKGSISDNLPIDVRFTAPVKNRCPHNK